MQDRATRIAQALKTRFPDAALRVEDDSHRHAGHAGARPGGETHYTVVVVTDAFAGLSRVARSRAAHAVLEAEFGSGLHALSLHLRTTAEDAVNG